MFAFILPSLLVLGSAASPDPVAVRVDRHLATAWEKAGIPPAARCDDATFLRRVTLDLIGRIPTAAEARAFLADHSPDKRTALVDRLLDSPAHARHMATIWRRVWLPQSDAPAFARLAPDFEDWIAERLAARTPYNRMVRELLTVPPGTADGGGTAASPRGFRAANEYKPENLAASAARAFLGVNLDCAQCHDHPFAKWTREQFWETAAFFARPPEAANGLPTISVGTTKKIVGPKLLTAAAFDWPAESRPETGAVLFAGWATSPENPFFARNAVNRLWAQLLGTGLVEPLDDLGGDAEHEFGPLLNELASAFASGGFDLRALTRGIVLSRVYQLASEPAPGQPTGEVKAFARAQVRGLTGEQLYDSIQTAAGYPLPDAGGTNADRQHFATLFHSERAGTAQRSVVQALSLMNGAVIAAAVKPGSSPAVRATDAPFFDAAGRVDVLFLSALGRLPTVEERRPLIAHLTRCEPSDERGRALADILWALLNTAEFTTNH